MENQHRQRSHVTVGVDINMYESEHSWPSCVLINASCQLTVCVWSSRTNSERFQDVEKLRNQDRVWRACWWEGGKDGEEWFLSSSLISITSGWVWSDDANYRSWLIWTRWGSKETDRRTARPFSLFVGCGPHSLIISLLASSRPISKFTQHAWMYNSGFEAIGSVPGIQLRLLSINFNLIRQLHE